METSTELLESDIDDVGGNVTTSPEIDGVTHKSVDDYVYSTEHYVGGNVTTSPEIDDVTPTNFYDTNSTEHYEYAYGEDDYVEFLYKGFDFERPMYLYAWEILVVLTTLANILVMAVLLRKNMRNSTNVILIAIAITDSLTGLVTLPIYIHAYLQYDKGYLVLSRESCEAFMIIKYYVSRSFHTVSIWLTVSLGFQRLVSVSFPFKAQTMFTIPKTVIMISIVSVLSPLLHLYHLLKSKAISGICEWAMEEPCNETCVYLWLVFYLMHFIPCLLLVVFSVLMVIKLSQSTKKMKSSNLITNKSSLHRRNVESRRISLIVIIVVIVFLIPEIPYGIWLLVTVSLTHAREDILDFHTNRSFHCAYEVLLLLSFHANFWVYLVMNRKFRHGLICLFKPVTWPVSVFLSKFGIQTSAFRRRDSNRSTTSSVKTMNSELHTHVARTGSAAGLELRTYHFRQSVAETEQDQGSSHSTPKE